jgi:hypothetical protein
MANDDKTIKRLKGPILSDYIQASTEYCIPLVASNEAVSYGDGLI